MSISTAGTPAGLSGLVDPISGSVARVLDRLKTAIGELGYEAVIEDLLSPELIGGEDSLLGSDDVMVIPGHLADSARPILLAVTKGWGSKEAASVRQGHAASQDGRWGDTIHICCRPLIYIYKNASAIGGHHTQLLETPDRYR